MGSLNTMVMVMMTIISIMRTMRMMMMMCTNDVKCKQVVIKTMYCKSLKQGVNII